MTFLTDIFSYILSSLAYCVYSLTWIVLHFLQNMMASKRVKYEASCQVMSIIWRRKFFMIDVVSPRDFIAFHEKYTDPSYVLHQNVSLYCFTTDYAYFIETSHFINIYNTDVSAFQYIGQFKHATKLIKLPMSSSCRIAETIGDPSVKVCFMPNTGRCGSTLLVKALDNIPGTLVHAEPDCLTNLGHIWKNKSVTQSEYEELLVATVRLLCKPRTNIDKIVIKTRVCGSCHTDTISKHFPDVTIMFGYRNSLKTVSSFLGVMLSETVQSLALYLIDSDAFSKVFPFFRRKMFYYFCYMLENQDYKENPDKMNSAEQFTYLWANCIRVMKTFKRQGGKFTPILYEDMIADNVGTLKKVLKGLGIDEKYIGCALRAFADDSQAGSPVSRENIQNLERRKIKYENIIKANKILSEFGLPNIGETVILEE